MMISWYVASLAICGWWSNTSRCRRLSRISCPPACPPPPPGVCVCWCHSVTVVVALTRIDVAPSPLRRLTLYPARTARTPCSPAVLTARFALILASSTTSSRTVYTAIEIVGNKFSRLFMTPLHDTAALTCDMLRQVSVLHTVHVYCKPTETGRVVAYIYAWKILNIVFCFCRLLLHQGCHSVSRHVDF